VKNEEIDMKVANIKIAIAVATLSVTATAAVAQPAAPNVMPEGQFTFLGKANLTKSTFLGNVGSTCDLRLTGEVSNTTDPAGIYIDVTSGSVTGSEQFCPDIDVVGFTQGRTGTPENPGTWEAFVPDSVAQQALNQGPLTAADVTFQNVMVEVPLLSDCTGNVTAKFSNGLNDVSDPSQFTFDASFDGCNVVTTQPSGLTVQPNMSDAPDVNVQ
tara:strand:- start:115 stop:756 length:642 start_codon:yes stop_codon:yes gene_type:complete